MTSADIWISLVVFVLIYIALGAADLVLMLRYARKELDDTEDEPAEDHRDPGAPRSRR